MKKILFAVVALVAMISCSKDYTIDYNKQAIAFGDVFVDNATRADYSGPSILIRQFNVYGTVNGNQNTVALFGGNGAVVERNNKDYGVAWDCSETEHWIPGANYQFEAVVDGTINNGTIAYTIGANPDDDGVNDLLYAKEVVNNAAADQGIVKFTFTHLLSKIQFTIANKMAANYSIEVTGITVGGVTDKGVYTISGDGTWAKASDAATVATPLSFGTTDVIASNGNAVASETHQILPVEQTLTVAIAYDIYYNDGTGAKKIASTTKSGNIPAQTYQKNTVYNITAEIDAKKIQFSVNAVRGFDSSAGNVTVQ